MKIKDVGFGEMYYGTSDLASIIPPALPYKFAKYRTEPWASIAEQWFDEGIRKESILTPIYGIDKEKAMKHISCLFNTWSLSRLEKIMNAAFLLSQWFVHIKL